MVSNRIFTMSKQGKKSILKDTILTKKAFLHDQFKPNGVSYDKGNSGELTLALFGRYQMITPPTMPYSTPTTASNGPFMIDMAKSPVTDKQ